MLSREYNNTAETLRRVARNVADQSIVDRLEALAADYERRAEKASLPDSALACSAARRERRKSSKE